MKVFLSILFALLLVGIFVVIIVFIPWLLALILIVFMVAAVARLIYFILDQWW